MSPLRRSQLLKGTTELLILSVLEDEPHLQHFAAEYRDRSADAQFAFEREHASRI